MAGQRLDGRREGPGGVAHGKAGGEAAQPFPRADPDAQIGDEIEFLDADADILDGFSEAGNQRRAGERRGGAQDGCPAAMPGSDVAKLIQFGRPRGSVNQTPDASAPGA